MDHINFFFESNKDEAQPYCIKAKVIFNPCSIELEVSYDEPNDEELEKPENFSYLNKLPHNWLLVIREYIDKNLVKSSDDRGNIIDSNGTRYTTVNGSAYEKYLQELIQACLEASGTELPLQIFYSNGLEEKSFSISFLERKGMIQNGNKNKIKTIEWPTCQRLINRVFSLDYIYPENQKKLRKGPRIDPGIGMWFTLEELKATNKHRKEHVEELFDLIKGF